MIQLIQVFGTDTILYFERKKRFSIPFAKMDSGARNKFEQGRKK